MSVEKRRPTLLDVIIIIIVLLVGVGGFWNNLHGENAGEQKYVTIFVDNVPVAELSLSPQDAYTYSFGFGHENRHTAQLEVQGGRVRMLPLEERLCPRGICSHTGWIAHPYESIVCLPNRIMVVFNTESQLTDIDGVTY